jgi:hypothetical protein
MTWSASLEGVLRASLDGLTRTGVAGKGRMGAYVGVAGFAPHAWRV